MHERARLRVGASQPPGDSQGILQDELRESFPGAGQADNHSRHLLVDELVRVTHPPCGVGGAIPVRSIQSLEGR